MNYNPPLLLRAALLALVTLSSSFAVDFTLAVTGSKMVTRGYSTVITVKPTVTAGPDEQAYVKVTGLPSGSTANWWYMKLTCCNDYAWMIATEQPVQIFVPASAQVATYPVTVTYTSFSGVVRSVTFPLQVLAEPVLTAPSFPPNVDLPEVSTWLANMAKYGTMHCTPVETQIGYEGYAWYYDGSRVYEQIAKILNDNTYLSCAQMFNDAYRQYVESAYGWLPGWRYFPHGLAMNYTRTGDQRSKAAAILLADGSPYAQDNSVHADMVYAVSTREIAYATSTVMVAERLGKPRSWKLPFLVDCLLGHFEQWFIQRTATPQPFMVALAAEALIEYYDLSQDPRIPGFLKLAADELWARSWDPVSQSFLYEEFSNNTRVPSNDSNLLIVPLYGWVFQKTGQSVYRERGDVIFSAGVKTAWLDGGKQFSQNYRWSPNYVSWRQSAAAPAPVPASIVPASGTPQSAAAGSAFGSPLAAIVKDKNGSPLGGVSVTFTAPASGASATFAGAQSTVVTTSASGIATTAIPVANATPGSYQILATVPGLPPAAFAMTNTAAAIASVTAGSLTIPWNPQGQVVKLTAEITGNAGVVNGGTVEFRVSGAPVGTSAVTNGLASTSYTLTASVQPGTLPVEARFSGWSVYPPAAGNGTITIVRRSPAVKWVAPANITQGTALGSAQLNATADTPGTFTYSPPAGTVLPAGAGQALTTTFTPTDTVHYTDATASTQITVVAPSSKPVDLMPVSAVATRDPVTRAVVVTITFKNLGGAANSTSLAFAMLGMWLPVELPPIGPVPELGTVTGVVKFSATAPSGPSTLLVFSLLRGTALSVVVP